MGTVLDIFVGRRMDHLNDSTDYHKSSTRTGTSERVALKSAYSSLRSDDGICLLGRHPDWELEIFVGRHDWFPRKQRLPGCNVNILQSDEVRH